MIHEQFSVARIPSSPVIESDRECWGTLEFGLDGKAVNAQVFSGPSFETRRGVEFVIWLRLRIESFIHEGDETWAT